MGEHFFLGAASCIFKIPAVGLGWAYGGLYLGDHGRQGNRFNGFNGFSRQGFNGFNGIKRDLTGFKGILTGFNGFSRRGFNGFNGFNRRGFDGFNGVYGFNGCRLVPGGTSW